MKLNFNYEKTFLINKASTLFGCETQTIKSTLKSAFYDSNFLIKIKSLTAFERLIDPEVVIPKRKYHLKQLEF